MRARHGRARSPTGRVAAAAAAVAAGLVMCPALATAGTTIAPSPPPAISTQTPLIDNQITASPGTWPDSPSFTYQWLDCDPSDPASCVPIPGATSSAYTVEPADAGATLEVAVSATDGAGDSGSATSAPTQAVAARPGTPVVQVDPTITGGGLGSPMTGTTGTWSPTPTSYSEQWYSCASGASGCDPIPGATGLTYTPTSASLGAVIVLGVYATNAAGDSAPDYSAPSAVVGGGSPTITVTAPANGATFAQGAQATAQFTCRTFDGSPPVVCEATDDSGNSVAAGGAIDTQVPGPHALTITAIDQWGSIASATVDYTVTASASGSSTPPPQQQQAPPAGTPAGAPFAVTGLRESATVWRLDAATAPARGGEATQAGTSFRFVASAPAVVTFAFTRLVGGRLVGGACVRDTPADRSRPACERTVAGGLIALEASAGPNRDRFDGRLGSGRLLAPGRYTATVTALAIGGAGAPTRVGTLRFAIVK